MIIIFNKRDKPLGKTKKDINLKKLAQDFETVKDIQESLNMFKDILQQLFEIL